MALNDVIKPGGTAVVTGAGLGIGRALVHALLTRGMQVVAIDVDLSGLEDHANLRRETLDVADFEALQALASQIGPVSLLVNNAVTRLGKGFDAPLEDWRRALDVNLWGVIHGVRAFEGQMAASAMVVNVGSKQGITNPPGHPVYNLSKAAIKSYTEGLAHALHGSGVSAHLLIPGWTTTGHATPQPGAWTPEQVVDHLFVALERGDFYVLCPDNEVTPDMDKARVAWAAGDITENRPALSRWHPDWAETARKVCS